MFLRSSIWYFFQRVSFEMLLWRKKCEIVISFTGRRFRRGGISSRIEPERKWINWVAFLSFLASSSVAKSLANLVSGMKSTEPRSQFDLIKFSLCVIFTQSSPSSAECWSFRCSWEIYFFFPLFIEPRNNDVFWDYIFWFIIKGWDCCTFIFHLKKRII